MNEVTVRDRVHALNMPDTPRFMWAAGNAVREAWRRLHGALPPKALRSKASGTGSHCFAVYPSSFVRALDAILRELNVARVDRAQAYRFRSRRARARRKESTT